MPNWWKPKGELGQHTGTRVIILITIVFQLAVNVERKEHSFIEDGTNVQTNVLWLSSL
jgi:hypothetical protein